MSGTATSVADEARPAPSKADHSQRPDIQGLRAVAVLVVIANHLVAAPVGGFVGVDIFFVISGFLITGLLLREYEKTEHISFRGFYRRRIRRIVPAATVVIAVTILAAFALFPADRAQSVSIDGLWAFLFSANWHMAIVGTDYFQLGLPPSPLQHYWSLSVEEQFYFVWPWVMLAILVLAAKRGVAHSARGSLVRIALIVVTVASFAWAIVETITNPTFAYFSTFSRAWELGVGALLATLVPLLTRIELPVWQRAAGAWVGIASLTASIIFMKGSVGFPGPTAAWPVISTALIIASGVGAPSKRYNALLFPLTNRVSTYLGDISYSLYLWHFPIVILMLAVFPSDSPLYIAICLAGTLAFSVLSYARIETPIRTSNWLEPRGSARRALPPRPLTPSSERRNRILLQSLALGTIAAIIVTLFAMAWAPPTQPKPTAGGTSVPSATPTVIPTRLCAGADFMDPEIGPTCDPGLLKNVLVPPVGAVNGDTARAFSCYRARDTAMRTCHYGSTSADALRVAVVGDSHAAMLLPALLPSLKKLNWSLDVYVGYGCQWKSPPPSNCSAVMKKISGLLSGAKPYDVIITSGARWVAGDAAAASTAYATAWNVALAKGSKVIVVADDPDVTPEALACISRIGFQASSNDCGTPLDKAFALPDPLLSAVGQSNGAVLIDLTKYYCTDSFCPSVIGETQVYRDTASHVTASYMKTLAPYLLARITAAIAP